MVRGRDCVWVLADECGPCRGVARMLSGTPARGISCGWFWLVRAASVSCERGTLCFPSACSAHSGCSRVSRCARVAKLDREPPIFCEGGEGDCVHPGLLEECSSKTCRLRPRHVEHMTLVSSPLLSLFFVFCLFFLLFVFSAFGARLESMVLFIIFKIVCLGLWL